MEKDSNKVYSRKKEIIKIIIEDLIFILIVGFLLFFKFPYVIYAPGGSIDLNDRIEAQESYKYKGSYSMNSVTVMQGSIPSMIVSLFKDDWDIKSEKEMTSDLISYNDLLKIEKIEYKNAVALATINAYTKAGKTINLKSQKLVVTMIDDEAKTSLKAFDVIQKVDNQKVTNLESLKKYIVTKKVGDVVNFKVLRDGKKKSVNAKVYKKDGSIVVGIGATLLYDIDVKPEIKIKSKSSESGPSGGLMLTLAIYDTITKGDLSHGKNIMGTGTIDENAKVGEIGGIKYKMIGAENDGADIFFVPKENYKEAQKVYKEKNLTFDLVCVETLDDAINYLNGLK